MPDSLSGKRVLVTRAVEQNTQLSVKLLALGAIPIEFPTIRILPPTDFSPLDDAIADLESYDWLILTSVNGVTNFCLRMRVAQKSVTDLQSLKIAAIGPATATELQKLGVRVDFVPPKHVAESLLETLPISAGERVLYPTSNIARDVLEKGLREKGVSAQRVTAYRTEAVIDAGNLPEILPTLDVLTFTSGSTARNFAALLNGQSIGNAVVACIGPIAADAARSVGLPVHIVPKTYTIAGMISAMEIYFGD